MAIKYIPRARGLFTFNSEISAVPEGSFDILDNLVIDKEGVLQPRRGYTTVSLTGTTGGSDVVTDFYEFAGVQLLKYPSGLYSKNGTVLTKYSGTFDVPVDAVSNNSVLANKNFYIATDDGVLKLDSVGNSFRRSGAPKAVPPSLSLTSGNILRPAQAFRYRALWGYTDSNNNLILGPPSDDVLIDNAGISTHNVNISIPIPDEITDNTWFLQLYRSQSAIVPDDELQLMFEKAPTTAQLASGVRAMTFTDDYSDTSLGALIYTAPGAGGGTLTSNDRPPKCVDLELFQNHTIYANTTTAQRRTFSIFATGAETGDIKANTTITINGIDYIGGVSTAEIFTITLGSSSNVSDYEGVTITIPFKSGAESILEFTADGKVVGDLTHIPVDIQNAGTNEEFELILGSDTGSAYEDDTITIVSKSTGDTTIFEYVADNGTVTAGNVRVDISSLSTREEYATELAVEINRVDGLTATATNGVVDVSQDTAGDVTNPVSSDLSTTGVTVVTEGANSLSAILSELFDVLTNNVQLSVVNNDPLLTITQVSAGTVDIPTTSDSTNVAIAVTQAGNDVEDISTRVFEVFITTSAGSDNELTARSLIRVINGVNAQVASGLIASYSSSAKLPGTVILEQKLITNTSFNVQALASKNAGNTTVGDVAFDPSLGTSPLASSNENNPNYLLISKPDQPEAVPQIQFVPVGSANNPIRRIKALRDSLFIFTDGGIYQMTGSNTGNFAIEELDLTARIIAPRTVNNLNNQVWALTTQGLVSITESAVNIRSRDIEDKINANFFNPTALNAHAFTIPYESDRKIIYFAPSVANLTVADEAWIFNTITNTWTRWDLSAKSGGIFQDKINLAEAAGVNIRLENKVNSFRDYADGGEEVAITSFAKGTSTTSIVVPDVTNLFVVNGLVTFDGELGFFFVNSVDIATNTIVVQGIIPGTPTMVQTFRPIPIKARWNPIDFGDVTLLKQFKQFIINFRRPFLKTMDFTVITDESRNIQNQSVKGQEGFGLWGSFPWGSQPWGGGEINYTNKRILIPRDKSHGIIVQPQISQSVAFSNFELTAIGIDWRPISERSVR